MHNKSSWPEWQKVTLAFGAWRAVLFLIGSVADRFIPYLPSFPYVALLSSFSLPRWVYSWANFDGVHYLTIAERGYFGTGLIQAFFPGYPGLVMLWDTLIHNRLVSGLVLANLAAYALAMAWYFFLKDRLGSQSAVLGSLLLWLFPTSFYAGALYSESLFILTVIICFWAADKKKWWVAGLAAALASGTRVVGIFLVPALLYMWWVEGHGRPRSAILPILLGSLGLLGFMSYLWWQFGDPLFFFHVQSEFGAGRQESLVLLPQVFWRYGKMLLTVQHTWFYWSLVQELAAAVLGVCVLSWGWWSVIKAKGQSQVSTAGIKPGELFFATLAFLLPTFTGTFSSLPRYLWVCFPIFIVLLTFFKNRRWWLVIYLIGSCTVLLINIWLFVQGYWVA